MDASHRKPAVTRERLLDAARTLGSRARLTLAQQLVLDAIAVSATRTEIAAQMSASVATVRDHIAAIAKKLEPDLREGARRGIERMVHDLALREVGGGPMRGSPA